MPRFSYVNGAFVPHDIAMVHIEDRGYQFSDGVYEVISYKDNKLVDWTEHSVRLVNSLDGLKIPHPVSMRALELLANELFRRNFMKNGCIYIQITRGVAPRNHQFPEYTNPSLVMTVSRPALPSKKKYEKGVSVITCVDNRWGRPDYKTISLLPNIMAKQNSVEHSCEEAIFINEDGFVTEGSATNFFIIDKEGVLRTHPADEHILGGITRSMVIKAAKDNKITVKEEPFTLKDVFNASGAFITSTTKNILPVTVVDGKTIGNGDVSQLTEKLMKLHLDMINAQ
ncbi:D-amino-acid transaminase [Rickettsiales bacterium]|nr:D-amino-acid transaminase [Rickettsiales bacterium]